MFLTAGIYEILITYYHYFAMTDVSYMRYFLPIDSLILMFVGPMFFFYTLTITTGKVKFTLKSTIHLLFAFPAFALVVYVASLAGDQRIVYLMNNYNSATMEMNFLNTFFYIHFIFYLYISLKRLKAFRKKQGNVMDFAWYQNYIILMLILLIVTFPICVIFDSEKVNLLVGQIIMNTHFIYVFIKILWSSVFFPSDSTQSLDIEVGKEKYAGSSLTSYQIEDFYKKIIQYLKKDKLFKEKEMTIVKIADQINISKHYLSQSINTKTNSNFSNLINQLRIEEAKKLLLSNDFSKYTIEAIAFEVGFGNKMSFNKAFKKFENTIPSEFRKYDKHK